MISIHAPRVGGDVLKAAYPSYYRDIFQSTPPVRGATLIPAFASNHHIISIHAPRAGGDS